MKKYQLIICLIIILILKIVIVEVQPISEQYTMKYDDLLMVNMADSILDGNWLGEYNYITLVKGVFTPLFIAGTNILNVPFLTGKEVFYGIACITFILILNKKIKNKFVLIILYLLILLNPIEYSSDLSRVYRDGLYMSLIVYLLSFALGIFLTRKESIKTQIKYFIGLGISISAICLCREENIWLLPFLAIMFIATIIPIFMDKKLENKVKRILLYLIPLAIFILSINIICIINYKYYGVYTLNQYWGTPFKSAYGALTRIKPETEIDRVPVTNETMNILYDNSDKFAELKEFFEGSQGKAWSMCGEKIDNEINGGYFHWALMDAVNSRGYYKDAKSAENYYIELANEINTLCDNGILDSRCGKRISDTCFFDTHDLMDVAKEMPKVIKYQYSLKDVKMKVKYDVNFNQIEGINETKELFKETTNSNLVTKNYYSSNINNLRLNIMEKINTIYKKINPYIFYISIISLIVFVILNIRNINKVYEELVILGGLIVMYITRIFIVTFTSTMMFKEALNVSYLACIYTIQMIFSILCLVFVLKSIKIKLKDKIKLVNK